MKFKIDADKFGKTLSEMTPFSGKKRKKNEDPDGLNARIKTANGSLILYTGDFDRNFYCERVVDANIISPGEATIEMGSAVDALSILSGEVEFSVAENYSSALLTKGNSKLPIRASNEKVWSVEAPKSGWSHVSSTANLVNAAKIANKCRRQDEDIRFAVNGIALMPTKTGVELVGTDGNLLVAVKTGIDMEIEGTILCQPELATALSTFDVKQDMQVCPQERALWMKQTGRLNVVGRNMGKFPDYRSYMDKNPVKLARLPMETVLGIKQAINKKVLRPTQQNQVRLLIDGDEIKLWGSNRKNVLASKLGKQFSTSDLNAETREKLLISKSVATPADALVRALSLFDDEPLLVHGPNAGRYGHLYFHAPQILVMTTLKPDYFDESIV